MKDRYRILVPYFTRSEWGPLTPLLKQMSENMRLEPITVKKKMDSLMAIDDTLRALSPDMVLCGFDRPEMVPVAYGAYHRQIPIAQIFAGEIAGGAFDDRDRFVISSFADLLFCSDYPQAERMNKSLSWRYKVGNFPRIVVSGATHFDDMEVRESYYTPPPYVLVLYNPPSLADKKLIKKELEDIKRVCEGRKVLWAQPNGDEGSDIVLKFADRMRDTDILPEMPRRDFLGVMKKASLFVGNSSAMFYEGAYFNVPYQQIGIRNEYREQIPHAMMHRGASRLICSEIINHLDVRKHGK